MISQTAEKKPLSIGVIMDGNRRWARERGIPKLAGHKAGVKKVGDLVQWAKAAGVKYVTLYAFSTENWNRPKAEVAYLMNLFRSFAKDRREDGKRENVRVKFVGQIGRFPKDLREEIKKTEKETKNGTAMTLVVALSYGGRAELLDAVKKLAKKKVKHITEDTLAKHLWTSDVPDPDLIIRTSGEHRLSNFLTWKSVYSELFFTKTYWPAFSETEFKNILKDYALRERRLGA